MKGLKTSLLLINFCLLSSCYAVHTGQANTDPPQNKATKNTNTLLKTTKMGLSILKTAHLSTSEGLVVDGGDFFKSFKIAHSAFLIRHPKGDLLFDTGLGRKAKQHFEKDMPWWAKSFFTYQNPNPIYQQLKNQNYEISQIKGIYLSHLHWDHAGGLHDFPKVPVYAPPSEKAHFKKHASQELGYFSSHDLTHSIDWKEIKLQKIPYAGFNQSLDIYGDQRLILVPLPGHTPGSLGLFINLPSGKQYFLSGDSSWSSKGIHQAKNKFWFASAMVDFNAQTLSHTLKQLQALQQANPQLVIIPSHDFALQEKLGFYPKMLY